MFAMFFVFANEYELDMDEKAETKTVKGMIS